MTIHLSVSIWTIICFLLLMLILRNLLFQPILEVMDARKMRIEKAAQKKAENEKRKNEYEAMLVEKEKVFYEEQKKQIKEEIEVIRLNTKKELKEAKEERLRLVDAYRVKAKEEQEEILHFLNVHSGELAEVFANSIIKG